MQPYVAWRFAWLKGLLRSGDDVCISQPEEGEMRTPIISAIIATTLFGYVATAIAQAPPHKLTAQEVKAAFVGNTSYSAGSSGPKTVTSYYLPDGVHITVKILPNIKDTGSYTLAADGTFCTKYPHLRNGAETCQSIYHIGGNVYRWVKPDNSTYDETVVPGNPDSM